MVRGQRAVREVSDRQTPVDAAYEMYRAGSARTGVNSLSDYGQAELRRLRDGPPDGGALGTLGVRVVDFSPGTVTLEWTATPAYGARSVPAVHGGMLAVLLDSAMGLALLGILEVHETYATTDLRSTLIRGAPFVTLRATGRVIHRGVRAAFCEGEIATADDRLIARGSATQLILGRRATD